MSNLNGIAWLKNKSRSELSGTFNTLLLRRVQRYMCVLRVHVCVCTPGVCVCLLHSAVWESRGSAYAFNQIPGFARQLYATDECWLRWPPQQPLYSSFVFSVFGGFSLVGRILINIYPSCGVGTEPVWEASEAQHFIKAAKRIKCSTAVMKPLESAHQCAG